MNEDDLFKAYEKYVGPTHAMAKITVGRRQALVISLTIVWSLVRHPLSKTLDISFSDEPVGSRNA